MKRGNWTSKKEYRTYPSVIWWGNTFITSPKYIEYIDEVFIDTKKMMAYFELSMVSGNKHRFDIKLQTRFHKKSIKKLFRGYKEVEIPFSPQDYFDNPCENLKELYESREWICSIFKNYLYWIKHYG